MAKLVTRRSVLAGLPAFALSLHTQAQSALLPHRAKKAVAVPPPFVYFGCDTDKGISKGIYVSRFDPTTGHLTTPILATSALRPAYFAFGQEHAGKRMMYVGNELSDASSTVSTFAVDLASGMLHLAGSVSAGAAGPCYISIDVTGRAVFAADYAGSAVVSYKVLGDGTLSPPVEVLRYNDHARFGTLGPRHDRQDAAHPHSATISPDNRFVVVDDLGSDRISILPFDPASAHFGEPSFFQLKPGSGPRHVAFHPNGRWIYGIDELANRIDQYLWTATHAGEHSQAMLVDTGHSVSTVAAAAGPSTTAAEVAISVDGRFLYASNRAIANGGEDTLLVFALNPDSGAPKLLQRIPCGGKMPRQFTFDPSGRWLLCGNQNSASITVFARSELTGKLTGPTQTMPLDSPMFTLFA